MSATQDRALFDDLAAGYDASFSERLPGIWLRDAVRRRLAPLLAPGQAVLEVGCGTGLDAQWLAERGCRVWATDASTHMLAIARERAARAGLAERIAFACLDLERFEAGSVPGPAELDVVLANFGTLNCVADLGPFFALAAERLQPGGVLAATVMGRFCLSETLYFLARGRGSRAARRWRGRSHFAASGRTQHIRYYSARELLARARGFEKLAVYGIGALLPCSEAFGLCERFPRLFARAAVWDFRLAPFSAWCSDHYLLLLRRRSIGGQTPRGV